MSSIKARGPHVRYHVKRGIVKDDCSFCQAGENEPVTLTKAEKNRRWLARRPDDYFAGWRARHPEYSSWSAMIQRCTNPNAPNYYLYGERGITACQRWRDSYEDFLADMGPRPSSGHSLDRYPDNNGNYEPGNVRWATRSEQQRNKRSAYLPEVAVRIVAERKAGHSWRKIADGLNADEIDTPRGKRWYGVTAKDCAVRATL